MWCLNVQCLTVIRELYVKVKILSLDCLHYGLQVILFFAAYSNGIALSLRLNFNFDGLDKLIDYFALLLGQALLNRDFFLLHSAAGLRFSINK